MSIVPILTQLDDVPVAGVAMGNVTLLRLDSGGGLAPGNKSFKLRGNLAAARRLGLRRLLSFGGAGGVPNAGAPGAPPWQSPRPAGPACPTTASPPEAPATSPSPT